MLRFGVAVDLQTQKVVAGMAEARSGPRIVALRWWWKCVGLMDEECSYHQVGLWMIYRCSVMECDAICRFESVQR